MPSTRLESVPQPLSLLGGQHTRWRPIPLYSLGLFLALAAVSTVAVAGPPGEQLSHWPIQELRTSFDIRHDLLNRHGVELENIVSTAEKIQPHRLSVATEGDTPFSALVGPSLDLLVSGGTPAGFSGAVWHQGGFDLVWDDGQVSLQAFGLRSGDRPLSLQIVDAEGAVIFVADHMQFDLDAEAGRLRAFNMDLRISSELARRLEMESLEGSAVGLLSLEAALIAPDPSDAGIDTAVLGPPACDDFSGDVDVALNNMSHVDNRLQQNGRVVMSPSAELVNVGTANVPWHSKFSSPSPPYNNDQHPFLVWAFYRLSEGRLEQLAVSDIKHAFLTLNFDCDPGACDQGNILGLGCGDVYGSGTNDSNNSLSYRHEVTASLGLWESKGSHFDGDGDGNQDHPPQNPDGAFDHRSWVEETDLETPGADYYTGAWYVVRDDINIFNNMGYRKVLPNQVGNTWDFDNDGAYVIGPMLDAWIDPQSPAPGTANSTVEWGDGHVQLAVATFVEGPDIRFEYVLHNHDFDPQIDSFSVPLGNATLVATSFRDLDDEPGNDWIVTQTSNQVTFTLPDGAPPSPRHTGGLALDWGLAYNFSVTLSGATVESGTAVASAFEDAPQGSQQIPTLVTATDAAAIFDDSFESGLANRWSDCPTPPPASDIRDHEGVGH